MIIKAITMKYLPLSLFYKVGNDLAMMEIALGKICTDSGELSPGLSRVNHAGGKRLRPLLARLSATYGQRTEFDIVPLMTMLELMHTASLIHDDIVDGASLRRGVPTINSQEGTLAALRSGDYLLSRAMERLKIYRGTGINELLSDVAQEMCLGEFEQRAGLYQLSGLTEEDYCRRVQRKTALLLSASCRTGAIAGGGSESVCNTLADFGLKLGLAFQLQDDLLDCKPDAVTGKPRMQDLRSGVVTLPLLLAARGNEGLTALAERRNKTEAELQRLCLAIAESGALEESAEALQRAADAAVAALAPLPNGEVKTAFTALARSVTEVK